MYMGPNSSDASLGGQNKNGTRTPPELVDLESERTADRNGGKLGRYFVMIGTPCYIIFRRFNCLY